MNRREMNYDEMRNGDLRAAFLFSVKRPGRLEALKEVAGILFVNDAEAKTPAAVRYSLEETRGPIVWIVSGRRPQTGFEDLVEIVREKVLAIVVTGPYYHEIQRRFAPAVHLVQQGGGMEGSVVAAARLCPAGGTVLFSPGTESSEDLGNEFKYFSNLLEV